MPVICALLIVCVRGGHAETVPPPRGGHAVTQQAPVRKLKRFKDWICIHGYEAAWNDAGDPYWGGLQMDRGFMDYYGADMEKRYGGYADKWPPAAQIIVAERAFVGYRDTPARGFTPWPNTARDCGLL